MRTASMARGSCPQSNKRRSSSRQERPASISNLVPELETSEQFPLLPLANTVTDTAILASIIASGSSW